jgi:hypothetical protein
LLLGVRFVLLALLVLVVAAFFVARPSEAQEQQSGGEGYVMVASYYGVELAGSPTAFTTYGVGLRQGEIDFFGAGAVLAQNRHYRQLHALKPGRYDAGDLS